jgi:hypothetical protein
MSEQIDIGKLTLSRPNKGVKSRGIYIEHNKKSIQYGEGGAFDEAKLEKIILQFYNKNF